MAASCSVYVSDSQLDSPCSTDQETSDSESSSETPVTTASPPTITTPANTRKRKRKEGGWQKNKRKRLRNTGQEYVTAKGKTVPPKHYGNTPCGCPLKCFEKVSEGQRQTLFDGFWASGDFNTQNAYISGCIKVVEIKRRYTAKGAESRRSNSRVYYVHNGAGISARVCRKAFLRIHGLSAGRVDRAIKAQCDSSGVPHIDQRGRRIPTNKTSDEQIRLVKEHINSFPKYQSHYSRSQSPHRMYLSPELTIVTMYNMYKQNHGGDSVSEWVYRKTFNERFNLSFGTPKTDTCKTCDSYKVRVEAIANDNCELMQVQGEWDLHKAKAERAYQSLKEDIALSQSDQNWDLLTFDLEQALATPILTTSVVFYKRQLWTYNLGIHNGRTGCACMHTWHEGLASRGSNEVASCLMKHLREMNSEAGNLVLYSDSCGGQNRNIGMVCTLMYIVASSEFSYKSIDHKFMVSGHSYLPNDRDFSSIETSKRKRSHIYTPQDWYELIRTARRKNPFHVCEMGTMDFVSVNKIKDNITNRKITTNGQKVEWLKMKWIQVTEGDPYQFRFRYSHNSLECWKVVNLKKRAKGRPIAFTFLPYMKMEDV